MPSDISIRNIASLGALITVMALALEPFFQQIVVFPERLALSGKSETFTAVRAYSDRTYGSKVSRNSTLRRGPLMGVAIDTAFNAPNETSGPATPFCPTGSCTWPPYTTLGVCHECRDVSFRLDYFCHDRSKKFDEQAKLRFPGSRSEAGPIQCGFTFEDWFVIGTDESTMRNRTIRSLSVIPVHTFTTLDSATLHANSTVFKNATMPIAGFYVAYTPGGPAAAMKNDTPVLLECMFSWCLKTMQSSFQGGNYDEHVSQTETIEATEFDEYGHAPVVVTAGSNMTFRVDNDTTLAFRDSILAELPNSLKQDVQYDFVPNSGIWNFHQVSPYDFSSYLAIVSRAMTDNLKSRPLHTSPVVGVAWEMKRFVQIRWVWISLPIASLVFSLILICATILEGRTTHAPIWKSSSLATLIHGLTEETRALVDPRQSLSQTEATSEKLRVKLSPYGNDVRLVAVNPSPQILRASDD